MSIDGIGTIGRISVIALLTNLPKPIPTQSRCAVEENSDGAITVRAAAADSSRRGVNNAADIATPCRIFQNCANGLRWQDAQL